MVVHHKKGKGRLDWLQKDIKNVVSATSSAIDQLTDWAEKAKMEFEEGLAHSMDRSLRLAVTGLSASGRTLFTGALGNGTRRRTWTSSMTSAHGRWTCFCCTSPTRSGASRPSPSPSN